ncbi:MAG TPA: hypothetical protein V6D46_07245, partial [Coleofasciculaceae cyanobacterium]
SPVSPIASVAPPVPQPAPSPAPEPIVSTGPDETFAPEPAPIAPAPASAELDQLWQAILVHVQPPATKMMLSQMGQLLSFDGQAAAVGMPPSWVAKFELRTKAIETAFQQHLQRPVTVSIRPTTVAGPQTNAPATSPKNPPRGTPPPYPSQSQSQHPRTATTTAANPTAGGFGGIATSPPPPAPGWAAAPGPDRPQPPPRPPGDRSTPRANPANPELGGSNPANHAPSLPTGSSAPNPGPDDPVLRSARSLAQLFNGEILQVDDADL